MKKTYQIPTLNLHQLTAECLLFVGTTIEVDPSEIQAVRRMLRVRRARLKIPTRPCAHSSITRWAICPMPSKTSGEKNKALARFCGLSFCNKIFL